MKKNPNWKSDLEELFYTEKRLDEDFNNYKVPKYTYTRLKRNLRKRWEELWGSRINKDKRLESTYASFKDGKFGKLLKEGSK